MELIISSATAVTGNRWWHFHPLQCIVLELISGKGSFA